MHIVGCITHIFDTEIGIQQTMACSARASGEGGPRGAVAISQSYLVTSQFGHCSAYLQCSSGVEYDIHPTFFLQLLHYELVSTTKLPFLHLKRHYQPMAKLNAHKPKLNAKPTKQYLTFLVLRQ